MKKKCDFEFNINNMNEIYQVNKVATQTNGSILYKLNNTVILANITVDTNEIVKEDFLPLIVQYLERFYASGKIPGGFVKREQKPGEFETMTSRIVDRSIRPLFPKGYKYPTQVTLMVLSADSEADLQVAALNAASAALYISDIPIKKSLCAVRVGKIDGEIVINPKNSDLKSSTLDLFLVGTKDEILMIEMRSIATKEIVEMPISTDMVMGDPPLIQGNEEQKINELSEDEFVEIVEIAQKAIKESTELYEKTFVDVLPSEFLELELIDQEYDEAIYKYIEELYKKDIELAIAKLAKSERNQELKDIAKEISKTSEAEKEEWTKEDIYKVVEKYKRELVRDMIVNKKIRADGRGLTDIRPISIETNILPSVHGSALFKRGETEVLAVTTIGGDIDSQSYELLTEKSTLSDRFMIHYNFHPFCVGEVKPLSPPSRRELGHGNLAKKAVEPTMDMDYDATIRIVAEVLESNGSSSMATICASSLSLIGAGIDIKKLSAGVAMGLVFEDDKYSILTDIMGLEDHDGDMDFKVAGTKDGLTALQMDIKLGGIDLKVLKEALYQAKDARLKILDIMSEVADKIVVNESILPSKESFLINPSKIVDIIGQAGKTIKDIVDRFQVTVDLDKETGKVKVAGGDKAKVISACEFIKNIANKSSGSYESRNEELLNFQKLYNIGDILDGEVKKVVEFGAFIKLPKGGEGLLHISKIGKGRINNINDYIKEGETVKIEILSVSKHRAELTLAKE